MILTIGWRRSSSGGRRGLPDKVVEETALLCNESLWSTVTDPQTSVDEVKLSAVLEGWLPLWFWNHIGSEWVITRGIETGKMPSLSCVGSVGEGRRVIILQGVHAVGEGDL